MDWVHKESSTAGYYDPQYNPNIGVNLGTPDEEPVDDFDLTGRSNKHENFNICMYWIVQLQVDM